MTRPVIPNTSTPPRRRVHGHQSHHWWPVLGPRLMARVEVPTSLLVCGFKVFPT